MSEATWYCARDGQRLGPFGFAQLQQMAADGTIRPHDLVLKEGEQGWRAASDIPGLMPAVPTPPSAPAPGVATTAQGNELGKWIVRNRNGVVVFVVAVAVVWGFWKYGSSLAVNRESARLLREEARRIEEENNQRVEKEKKRQVPPDAVRVRKDQGTFSHDLRLTNASGAAYGRCDVKLIVYYEKGKRSEVARYWTDWAPQEEKVVNVPAEGNIERMDLTGTVTDPVTGQPRTLASVHEWKPGKPVPGPGR
jgi:hypothetical protein